MAQEGTGRDVNNHVSHITLTVPTIVTPASSALENRRDYRQLPQLRTSEPRTPCPRLIPRRACEIAVREAHLAYIRKAVHAGCPDVEETLKWSVPSFTYKGIFAGMAAFKQHCIFGFWKHGLLLQHGLASADEEAMVKFAHVTSVKDLPDKKTFIRLVKAATTLHDAGIKAPTKARPAGPRTLTIPADLKKALAKNRKAGTQFAAFSYSKKKDYVEWVTGAKAAETRQRRLQTAIAWIGEGKSRNWKYEKC